jgi:phosphoglycolate phosphatase
MSIVRSMLFDLDGTLLDSAPDLVASLNSVRESEGLPPLALSEMKPFASKGAIGLLKAGMPAAAAPTLEIWRQRFLEHYAQNSCRHSMLFDGIPELLDLLDEHGIPWGIVTNKTEVLTLPIVEAFGLKDRIGCVVCGDTLAESKPHPAPVALACGIVDVDPADTLFVGDDVRDIQAGRAAGTQTAAVFYGYGSHELMDEVLGDSFPVHRPADLAQLVQEQHGAPDRQTLE